MTGVGLRSPCAAARRRRRRHPWRHCRRSRLRLGPVDRGRGAGGMAQQIAGDHVAPAGLVHHHPRPIRDPSAPRSHCDPARNPAQPAPPHCAVGARIDCLPPANLEDRPSL